jgi:hypothetical protein
MLTPEGLTKVTSSRKQRTASRTAVKMELPMIGWSLSLGVLPNELGPQVTATCQPGAALQYDPAFSLRKYRPEVPIEPQRLFKKSPIKVVPRPCFRNYIRGQSELNLSVAVACF